MHTKEWKNIGIGRLGNWVAKHILGGILVEQSTLFFNMYPFRLILGAGRGVESAQRGHPVSAGKGSGAGGAVPKKCRAAVPIASLVPEACIMAQKALLKRSLPGERTSPLLLVAITPGDCDWAASASAGLSLGPTFSSTALDNKNRSFHFAT